jgi:hypothetical protein
MGESPNYWDQSWRGGNGSGGSFDPSHPRDWLKGMTDQQIGKGRNIVGNDLIQNVAGALVPGLGTGMKAADYLAWLNQQNRHTNRMNPKTNWIDDKGYWQTNVPPEGYDPSGAVRDPGYWDQLVGRSTGGGGQFGGAGGWAGSSGGGGKKWKPVISITDKS